MAQPDARTQGLDVLAAFAADGRDIGTMDEALPAIRAYLEAYAAPDFACAMVPLPPTPEVVYHGVEGFERAWEDWGGTFESVRVELEEMRDSASSIVLLVKQIAVTRHGGVEITQPSAMVWKLGKDGITRLEFHLDQDAALVSAGLSQ